MKHKDLAIMLFVLIVIGFVFYEVNITFDSPEDVRLYIEGFGAYGPLVVIGLIILEVILAPVPGIFISIGSGAVFGAFLGTVYTYIGNMIGTSLAFFLSRRFGRPLAQRLIKESKLEYYDSFFHEKGVYGLWIAYIFPVFPIDIISFVTGLSSIKYRKFILIAGIGFIPNMFILNVFGDSLFTHGFGITTIIVGSFLVLLFLGAFIYMWRSR